MEVLLMTGTIKPFSNIRHCDVNIRYKAYVKNILQKVSLRQLFLQKIQAIR